MTDRTGLRWAEDGVSGVEVPKGRPALVPPPRAPSGGKTGLKTKPSYPHPTDENKPTNEHLWQKVLDVASGDLREYTQGDRTIHAPNDGRGFLNMPSHPNGIAWAVKQYKGFGGAWKPIKEDKAASHVLRVLAAGGVGVSEGTELDALAAAGLVRVSGEQGTRRYWDITAAGRKVVMAGLVDEVSRRMEKLLSAPTFDPGEAKALGVWILNNFRIDSPKTPSGGKAVKERMQRLVWVLKNRHSMSAVPDSAAIASEIRSDWEEISPHLGALVKFTDEGGQVVPKEWNHSGVLYINEAGVPEPTLEKYVKRLGAVISSLRGWRKKATASGLVVVLKPPNAFNGTASGKYKSAEDVLWVRTTPAVLKRAQGYGSFEYIVIHEIGHRFERLNRLPRDFDRLEWHTTRYSRKEGVAGSESFAELFALGHFDIKGNWDQAIIERFESVMTGKKEGTE